jgi:hypothetical protein
MPLPPALGSRSADDARVVSLSVNVRQITKLMEDGL